MVLGEFFAKNEIVLQYTKNLFLLTENIPHVIMYLYLFTDF